MRDLSRQFKKKARPKKKKKSEKPLETITQSENLRNQVNIQYN